MPQTNQPTNQGFFLIFFYAFLSLLVLILSFLPFFLPTLSFYFFVLYFLSVPYFLFCHYFLHILSSNLFLSYFHDFFLPIHSFNTSFHIFFLPFLSSQTFFFLFAQVRIILDRYFCLLDSITLPMPPIGTNEHEDIMVHWFKKSWYFLFATMLVVKIHWKEVITAGKKKKGFI